MHIKINAKRIKDEKIILKLLLITRLFYHINQKYKNKFDNFLEKIFDNKIYYFYNINMEMDTFVETEVEIGNMDMNLDSVMDKVNKTEPEVLASSFLWVKEETLVLIVKAKNEQFENFYNFDICGKKMIDWVMLSTSACTQKILENENMIFEALMRYAKDYKHIAVFFSDTPLLQKSTFLEIMKYFSAKKMNFLPLQRGFIINSQYVENYQNLISTPFTTFGTDDFYIVNDAKTLSYAFKVLNKRILSFHKNQGVILFGEDTIFIEADVQIEEGVIIYPNNILKGESYIGKNVVLESGNYIADTIVCDNAIVCQSYLEKSKVPEGKTVGPFEKLINETL